MKLSIKKIIFIFAMLLTFITSVSFGFFKNYKGTHDIPGDIKVEEYCKKKGIKLEEDARGKSKITSIDEEDWVSFTIGVKSTGTYLVEYKISSNAGGGNISMEYKDGKVLGKTFVPRTKKGSWETVYQVVEFDRLGKNIVKLYALPGGFELSSLSFTKFGKTIPGVIDPVKYDRMENINTEGKSALDGYLGWMARNDWAEYDVNIREKGLYTVSFLTASDSGFGGEFDFLVDGKKIRTVALNVTESWFIWKVVRIRLKLEEGNHTIRLMGIKSYGDWVDKDIGNIKWIKFKKM